MKCIICQCETSDNIEMCSECAEAITEAEILEEGNGNEQ